MAAFLSHKALAMTMVLLIALTMTTTTHSAFTTTTTTKHALTRTRLSTSNIGTTSTISTTTTATQMAVPSDQPLWSDDLAPRVVGTGTGTSSSSSRIRVPTSLPQTTPNQQVFFKTLYEDWKIRYDRPTSHRKESESNNNDNNDNNDYNDDNTEDDSKEDRQRFQIFQRNVLESMRVHQRVTAQTQLMEGTGGTTITSSTRLPSSSASISFSSNTPPPTLALNAYADCTPEEYRMLRKKEASGEIKPRPSSPLPETVIQERIAAREAKRIAELEALQEAQRQKALEASQVPVPADVRGPDGEDGDAITSFQKQQEQQQQEQQTINETSDQNVDQDQDHPTRSLQEDDPKAIPVDMRGPDGQDGDALTSFVHKQKKTTTTTTTTTTSMTTNNPNAIKQPIHPTPRPIPVDMKGSAEFGSALASFAHKQQQVKAQSAPPSAAVAAVTADAVVNKDDSSSSSFKGVPVDFRGPGEDGAALASFANRDLQTLKKTKYVSQDQSSQLFPTLSSPSSEKEEQGEVLESTLEDQFQLLKQEAKAAALTKEKSNSSKADDDDDDEENNLAAEVVSKASKDTSPTKDKSPEDFPSETLNDISNGTDQDVHVDKDADLNKKGSIKNVQSTSKDSKDNDDQLQKKTEDRLSTRVEVKAQTTSKAVRSDQEARQPAANVDPSPTLQSKAKAREALKSTMKNEDVEIENDAKREEQIAQSSNISDMDSLSVKPDNRGGIFVEPKADIFPDRKQQEAIPRKTQVSPQPPAYASKPNDKAIFGSRSAMDFPERTEAHNQPTSRKSEVSSASTKSSTSSASTSSRLVQADAAKLFGVKSATMFPKRTEAHSKAPVKQAAYTSQKVEEKTLFQQDPRDTSNLPKPAASFVRPDLFFNEKSAMTFPKRTQAHNPPTSSPSTKMPKKDFQADAGFLQGGDVTSFPKREESYFALVRASQFRDKSSKREKRIQNDQKQMNLGAPFSFAKGSQAQDLPPPDTEEIELREKEAKEEENEKDTSAIVVEGTTTQIEDIVEESDKNEDTKTTKESRISSPFQVLTKNVKSEIRKVEVKSQKVVEKKKQGETKDSRPSASPVKPKNTSKPRMPTGPVPSADYRAAAEARMREWKESRANPAPTTELAIEDVEEEVVEDVSEMVVEEVEVNEESTESDKELEEQLRKLQEQLERVEAEARERAAVARELFHRSLLETQFQESIKATKRKAEKELLEMRRKAIKDDSNEEGTSATYDFVVDAATETVDEIALREKNISRQEEIENALKADFNAAAQSDDHQKQVEAIFEGRLKVETNRPEQRDDPFSVKPLPAKSSPSTKDVLQAEMDAAQALRLSEAGMKEPTNTSFEATSPSLEEVLKAEMEAASKLKETAPLSSSMNTKNNRENRRKNQKCKRKKNKGKRKGKK